MDRFDRAERFDRADRLDDLRADRLDDLRAVQTALVTLARVQNSHRARRQIEERAAVPLSPLTISALSAIKSGGPVRHGAIAKRLGVQPSRVSKEVRVLVEAGFVRERPDPADRRATLLEITRRGEQAHQRYRTAAADTLADVLADWTDRDLHRLAGLLSRLAERFAAPASPITTTSSGGMP